MKDFFRSPPGEKAGTIDGLNLFFGALLGANLGTMQSLGLYDYVKMIFLLAGTVMVLRMISTSERRGYTFGVLAVYVILVPSVLLGPGTKGLGQTDLYRLVATLGMWVLFVLAVELTPVTKQDSPRAERGGR